MGKKRPASPVYSGTDTKKKKRRKESDSSKKERHKHKKHSHATTKKHSSTVDSKVSHKTITLDNIPDSLLPHRSLINFVDDRSKLLDEVFSIFSEEEISNMLPDILKGIKLDEVQKLCYEQLKAMEVTAITEIIQSSGDSKANDMSSNEDDIKVTTFDHAPHHSSKQKENELLVASEVDDVATKKSPLIPNSNNTLDDSLLNDKQSTNDGENSDTNISTANVSTRVLEYSGSNEDSIELLPVTGGDDIDRELTLCPAPSAGPEDNSKQATTPVVTEPVAASVTSSSVCETAVLTELYLRKRALQSQLKKQQLEKKINEQRNKEELLLRQKALQSLLAAKTKNENKRVCLS